ncbi:hypothetical protein ABIE79_010285 [Bradyrhizobium diazoefficiens]
MKKTDQALVSYLTRDELQALLDAPDASTVSGIRDRAMLHLAFAAGMRVSELVSLRLDQIDRQTMSSVHIMGKGRRERVLPLWKQTAAAVKAWLKVRPVSGAPELFFNARAQAMTRSGFEYILTKHVATAARKAPSIAGKGVSPHVLRHSCAMHTLQATRDVRKVSLWLGHASLQSTEVYLRADPTEKLEALAAMTPPMLTPGRFQAPDKLLAIYLQDFEPRSQVLTAPVVGVEEFGRPRSPSRWSLPRGNLPPHRPAAPDNAGSSCDRHPSAGESRAGWCCDQVM